MKTIQDIQTQLTEREYEFLQLILEAYDSTDVVCYMERLSTSQKGIAGSLVKKGLIYDSYEGTDEEGNWFPNWEVLEAFSLPPHWPY
jgi:Mg/Co/Ni transporter MgtE